MKSLNEFVALFAEQFDETDPSEITAETAFRDLDEWSSIVGMCVIGMIKQSFGIDITGAELRECVVVSDVYQLIIKIINKVMHI